MDNQENQPDKQEKSSEGNSEEKPLINPPRINKFNKTFATCMILAFLMFSIWFGYYYYINIEYMKGSPCQLCADRYNATCYSQYGTKIINDTFEIPSFKLGIGNNEQINWNTNNVDFSNVS